MGFEYFDGLLRRNYQSLKDSEVLLYIGNFLQQYPDPDCLPSGWGDDVIFLKHLTKVASWSFTGDKSIFGRDILASLVRYGERCAALSMNWNQVHDGENRRRSLQSHSWGHLGEFCAHLATVSGDSERAFLLGKSYVAKSRAIELSDGFDEVYSASSFADRAVTTLLAHNDSSGIEALALWNDAHLDLLEAGVRVLKLKGDGAASCARFVGLQLVECGKCSADAEDRIYCFRDAAICMDHAAALLQHKERCNAGKLWDAAGRLSAFLWQDMRDEPDLKDARRYLHSAMSMYASLPAMVGRLQEVRNIYRDMVNGRTDCCNAASTSLDLKGRRLVDFLDQV